MSTGGEAINPELVVQNAPLDSAPASSGIRSWFARCDDYIEWAGEWFNPILVKECRQSLKSMQFIVAFFLTLAACWFWSIFSTVDSYDVVSNTYIPNSNMILDGYLTILAFPLIVVVPYCAFRSLASERDDKTFELLAVTTLTPRQIVIGKFLSAVVQVVLYISAVLPCLAFSYLLQGIDFRGIGFSLFWLTVVSITYTLLSLLFATIAKDRFWQILLSLVIIIWEAVSFLIACAFLYSVVHEFQYMTSAQEFWMTSIVFFVNILAACVLLFFASASQITFASDNRSTALRICCIAQNAIFVGSMAYLFWHIVPQGSGNDAMGLLFYTLMMSAIYWYVIGIFTTGEPDLLSPRVKRGLPQSQLGMMFLTWFFPGPGRGYLFVIGNFLATFFVAFFGMAVFAYTFHINVSTTRFATDCFIRFGIYLLGYLMIYLGVGTLIMRYLQRKFAVGVFARALLHVILLLMGIIGPMVLMIFFGNNFSFDGAINLFNPLWGIIESLDGKYQAIVGYEWIVIVVGLAVMICNIPGIILELRQVKMVMPLRLAEEQKSLEVPPAFVPQNPWDEPGQKA